MNTIAFDAFMFGILVSFHGTSIHKSFFANITLEPCRLLLITIFYMTLMASKGAPNFEILPTNVTNELVFLNPKTRRGKIGICQCFVNVHPTISQDVS